MAAETSSAPGGLLQQFSDALASTVERAGASVVRVEARERLPATGIIWSADGLIVTANHVVERDDEIYVGLGGGKRVKAALVGRDPSTDTALLRAEASGLTVAPRTPAGALKVGQLVLAIGRPGEEPTLSLGVVSAIGGGWQLRRGGQAEALIQSDVTFYPGFSGGPLVDASGRVAGLNSSHLARGASISLPTAVVERTVEALLKHGRIKRGYLGIGTQVVPLPAALASLVGGRERGLMIVTVAPDSPADRGGLLLGDILVGIAGQPVTNPEELQAQLGSDRVGQQVAIQVLRGGVPKEVQVTVGERPEQEEGR